MGVDEEEEDNDEDEEEGNQEEGESKTQKAVNLGVPKLEIKRNKQGEEKLRGGYGNGSRMVCSMQVEDSLSITAYKGFIRDLSQRFRPKPHSNTNAACQGSSPFNCFFIVTRAIVLFVTMRLSLDTSIVIQLLFFM